MDRPVALILCGGHGERMRPWSERRPKTLFAPALGESLFVRHVRHLAGHGFEIHANPSKEWLSAHREDVASLGVKVRWWPETGKPNGSATSIARVARTLARNRVVLAVYGDVWFERDHYAAAYRVCNSLCDAASIMVGRLPDGEPRRGMLRINGTRKVLSFDEGGKKKCHDYHGLGMVAIRADAIPRRFRGDISGDLIPWLLMAEQRNVTALFANGARGNPVDCGDLTRFAGLAVRQYLAAFGIYRDRREDGSAAAAILRARRIVTAGNGGSLAVAQHAAQDWAKVGGKDARALNDPSFLTAFGNDCGYEYSLSLQLALIRLEAGDVVAVYSGSGTSGNVLRLLEAAQRATVTTVIVTSVDGGGEKLKSLATHVIRAPWPAVRMQECEDFFSAWSHGMTRAMAGLAPLK